MSFLIKRRWTGSYLAHQWYHYMEGNTEAKAFPKWCDNRRAALKIKTREEVAAVILKYDLVLEPGIEEEDVKLPEHQRGVEVVEVD